MASKNVAAQKLMVKLRRRLGSAVDFGSTPAKVISISEKNVVLRPIYEQRPHDAAHVRIPIETGCRVDYTGGWGTYTEIDTEGLVKIRALQKELFPGIHQS
jgi:hypothetical protein